MTMLRIISVAFTALLALVALPAVAGMGSHVSPRYDPGIAQSLASGGMPTVVRTGIGTPDGVAALLRRPGWMRDGTFVTAPPATAGTRLVFVIAPVDAVAAKRDICDTPNELAVAEQGRRLVIRAAFCEGDRILSRATASESAVGGADDPRFARILNRMVDMLLPRATRFQVDPPGI